MLGRHFLSRVLEIQMMYLCEGSLTELLQAVVDWGSSLNDDVVVLPVCEELACRAGEEQ